MTPAAVPLPAPWRIRRAVGVLIGARLSYAAALMLLGAVIGFGTALSDSRLSAQEYARLFVALLQGSPWTEALMLLQYLLAALCLSAVLLRPFRVPLSRFFPASQWRQDARAATRLVLQCLGVTLLLVGGIIVVIMIGALLMRGEARTLVDAYTAGVEREGKQFFAPHATRPVGSPMDWMRVAQATLIMPPLEELLFRGALYGALRRRFAPWPAALVSSAAFALAHPYLYALPNTALIGVLTARAYERTRSLRTPMLFHMLWNGLAASAVRPVLFPVWLAAMLFLWRRPGPRGARATAARPAPGWRLYVWVFGALCLLGPNEARAAWMILLILPAWFGLFCYAHRRPAWWRISPGLTRAYAAAFAGWCVMQLSALTQPAALQKLAAELGDVRPATADGIALFGVLALGLLLAPAFLALRRLAVGAAGAHDIIRVYPHRTETPTRRSS